MCFLSGAGAKLDIKSLLMGTRAAKTQVCELYLSHTHTHTHTYTHTLTDHTVYCVCFLLIDIVLQMTTLPNQRWSSSEDPAVIGQKRTFVKLLDSTSSFSDLAENLQEVMRWCGDRKLVRERRSLAFMCLKCRRMVSMEAEGLRYTT